MIKRNQKTLKIRKRIVIRKTKRKTRRTRKRRNRRRMKKRRMTRRRRLTPKGKKSQGKICYGFERFIVIIRRFRRC